uniref:Placenta associated 8 n=5 Tax=Canis lupus TaxID=9612 RepID=A0A8I3PCD1_CANLF
MHTNNPGCQSVLKIHHSMETFLNSPVKLSPPLFLGSARCPIECLLLVLRSHPLSSLKSTEFTGGLLPSTRILLPPPPLSQPLLFLWLCLKEALPAHPVQGSAFWNLVLKMNPVVSQPGYGTAGSMMNSDWQTGMFDCFDDLGICLCGAFCPLCLSCQIASDMNECCLCGASVAMRTLYRTRFGIPGSIFSDFLWLGCFPLCTLCQLKRDIEKRKAMNAF